jgi:hypothetical protein
LLSVTGGLNAAFEFPKVPKPLAGLKLESNKPIAAGLLSEVDPNSPPYGLLNPDDAAPKPPVAGLLSGFGSVVNPNPPDGLKPVVSPPAVPNKPP